MHPTICWPALRVLLVLDDEIEYWSSLLLQSPHLTDKQIFTSRNSTAFQCQLQNCTEIPAADWLKHELLICSRFAAPIPKSFASFSFAGRSPHPHNQKDSRLMDWGRNSSVRPSVCPSVCPSDRGPGSWAYGAHVAP